MNKDDDSGSDSSDISIEPGEMPPEAFRGTVDDDNDQFSSDMDVPDELPNEISQPLTSSDPQYDHHSDNGMSTSRECCMY